MARRSWGAKSLKFSKSEGPACLSTLGQVCAVDEAARISSRERISCMLEDGKINLVIRIGLIQRWVGYDQRNEMAEALSPKNILLDSHRPTLRYSMHYQALTVCCSPSFTLSSTATLSRIPTSLSEFGVMCPLTIDSSLCQE